jgi:hypothetical protein
MHPLTHPVEPHFVHLSWAVRRLTQTQARYIRTFYGDAILAQLEALEHRAHPHHRSHGPHAAGGEKRQLGAAGD